MRYETIASIKENASDEEVFLKDAKRQARQWLLYVCGLTAIALLSTVVMASVRSPRTYWNGLAIETGEIVAVIFVIFGGVPESAIVVSFALPFVVAQSAEC